MKNNLVGESLSQLNEVVTPKREEVASAPAVITEAEVEALKEKYGAKWATAVRRGNPYGRKAEEGEGEYVRATYIVEKKQHKALTLLAKAEGLQIKEALEIVIEVGLKALTGSGSEDIAISPEDFTPKFTRKK